MVMPNFNSNDKGKMKMIWVADATCSNLPLRLEEGLSICGNNEMRKKAIMLDISVAKDLSVDSRTVISCSNTSQLWDTSNTKKLDPLLIMLLEKTIKQLFLASKSAGLKSTIAVC